MKHKDRTDTIKHKDRTDTMKHKDRTNTMKHKAFSDHLSHFSILPKAWFNFLLSSSNLQKLSAL
jgi:hypothetical protein